MSAPHTDPSLASWLREPPVIFLGLTQAEVLAVGAAAGGLGLVTVLFSGLALGSLAGGAVCGALVIVVVAAAAARQLRKLRATRPRGYLQDRWRWWWLRGGDIAVASRRYGKGRRVGTGR